VSNDFLTKPFHEQEELDAIQHAIAVTGELDLTSATKSP
jgi:FixJ family two-component response regulator